ncbi:MAG: hypothetical protein EOP83_08690 [Verrucomicrobiaceae bacterium]|nr:MAG: hypothetical protein EOP83_08690 [Verrucomicrobiaceae bacterium]
MDALIDTLNEKNIPVEPTSKFFFKSFPFRVTLDADRYARYMNPAVARKNISSIWRKVGTMMVDLIEIEGEVRVRRQGGIISAYFNDVNDVFRAIEKYPKHILNVATPINDRALQAMAGDSRIEVRDQLYWNKYRWVATFKGMTTEQGQEVSDWLRQYKENNDEILDKFFLSFSNPVRVYFTDENDLFYFRVVFYEHIARIEKALLTEEIANERLSAEDACAA